MNLPELLKTLPEEELIQLYGHWITELKDRNIIRTNNIVGELGEYIAIKTYRESAGIPNLQAAPTGTQNVDALSRNGDRYSVKATTGKVTGVFYGLNDPDSNEVEKQKFEYVVLVLFNDDFSLRGIYELNWESFLKHKRWHSRMRAWNLSVTKKLLDDAKAIITA